MEDKISKLELRITELENKLKEASGSSHQIDPEEFKTFQKVSAQLSPKFCTCSPCSTCFSCFVCHPCILCNPCRVCRPCINECTCGPCIQTAGGLGAANFGNFME